MAEKLILLELFGDSATIDRDKVPHLVGTVKMKGFRHQLFAGTTFSVDENINVDCRNLINLGKHLLHCITLPYNIFIGIGFLQLSLQTLDLVDHRMHFDGPFDICFQASLIHRFRHIIKRPYFHGFHGGIHRVIFCHHQNRNVPVRELQAFENIQPRRHVDVQTNRVGVFIQHIQAKFAVVKNFNPVTLIPKPSRHHFPMGDVRIHNK